MATATARKAPTTRRRGAEAVGILRRLVARGLTPVQIAQAVRTSERSVYRWLNEGKNPHPLFLDALRGLDG